jgi:tetratricopeptide (TPR) repeat protein
MSIQKLMEKAQDSAATGEYTFSIGLYTQALALEKSAELYCLRGDAFFHLEEYDEAIADCNDALRLSSEKDNRALVKIVYNLRAHSYGEKGDYARSIIDYSEAIRLGLEDGDKEFLCSMYFCRGTEYKYNGENEKSQADYDEYNRLQGFDINEINKFFLDDDEVSINNEEDDSSESEYFDDEECEDERSKFHRALQELKKKSDALKDASNYDAAIAVYTEALNAGFKETHRSVVDLVYHYRADIYFEMGEYEKAIADYNEFVQLGRDYNAWDALLFYYKRGVSYQKIGNNNKALINYTKAFRLGIEDKYPEVIADLYYNRGMIFMEKGEHEKAIADFKVAKDKGNQKAIEKLNELGAAYN